MMYPVVIQSDVGGREDDTRGNEMVLGLESMSITVTTFIVHSLMNPCLLS